MNQNQINPRIKRTQPEKCVQNLTALFPNFTKKSRKIKWNVSKTFNVYSEHHACMCVEACLSNQLHVQRPRLRADYRGSRAKPNKLFIFNLKDHVRFCISIGLFDACMCAFTLIRLLAIPIIIIIFIFFHSFSTNFDVHTQFFLL